MNHDETHFNSDTTPPLGAELEARVVAWVAGELPPAEVAELEHLAAANPAILIFKRRMEAVQGLVAEAERAEVEPLRLAPERRAQLIRTLGGTEAAETVPAAVAGKVVALPRHPARWWRHAQLYYGLAGAAAACLVVLVVWEQRQPVLYKAEATMKYQKPDTVVTTQGVVDTAVRSEVDINTVAMQAQSMANQMNRPGTVGAKMQTDADVKRGKLTLAAPEKLSVEQAGSNNLQVIAPDKAILSWSAFGSGKSGGVDVAQTGSTTLPVAPAEPLLSDYKPKNLVSLDGYTETVKDALAKIEAEAAKAESKQEMEARLGQDQDVARAVAESQLGQRGLARAAKSKVGAPQAQDSTTDNVPVFTAGQITTGAIKSGSTLTLSATGAAGKPLATRMRPESYGGSLTLAAPNAAAEEAAGRLDAFSVLSLRESATLAKESAGGRARAAGADALGAESNLGSVVGGAISNESRVRALARGMDGGERLASAPAVEGLLGAVGGAPSVGSGMITVPSFGDAAAGRTEAGTANLSKDAQVSTVGSYASSIPSPAGAEPSGFFTINGSLKFADMTAQSVVAAAVPAAAAAAATVTTSGVIEVPSLREQDGPRPVSAPKLLPAVTEVATAAEPVSTFSLHVADVSFRLAQAALARGERPDPARIRAEEFYNAFDYGDPPPSVAEKIGARIEQAGHPFLAQRNLVRVALRVASDGRGATPLHLTVLLDTSGSMEREDRAAAVRRALEVLVSLLGPNDRITLIGFARTPRLLAENVAGDRARSLLEILGRTPSEGGTNLEEAIKLGGELARRHFAAGAQNRVVLLTDGAANLGDADPAQLGTLVETLRQQNLAFDACGVGLDGLDDEVLESLTRRGDGRYYALNSAADADKGFAQKLAGAFRPAAENVKVQVRFNPARVGHYRLVGFEQHRLREEDFRNDAVNAAELAADENAVALYQVELLPGGEGELGELFVRFRDPATAQAVERRWTLPYDAAAPAFDRATPTLQLASASALLAEKFRGGVGETVKLADLSAVAATLRGRYAQDARVQEFVTMIAQARRLYGDAP